MGAGAAPPLAPPIENRLPWVWDNVLDYLKRPGRRFVNPNEARGWIEKADRAKAQNNLAEMRTAVNHAWGLLPPDTAEAAKQQAAQTGLRGT